MNLGELHATVSSAIARGTSLDNTIPSFVRMAARWLERNYTYKYMERFGEFAFDIASDFPRRITFPNDRVKRFNFVRGVNSDGSFQYQKQIDPQEINSVEEGMPLAFWLDGTNDLVFDRTPDENYTEEIAWEEYTAWPTSTSAETWLLVNAEDLLLSRTIMHLAPLLRDPKLVSYWQEVFASSLKTSLDADAELRAGSRNDVMNYAMAFRA